MVTVLGPIHGGAGRRSLPTLRVNLGRQAVAGWAGVGHHLDMPDQVGRHPGYADLVADLKLLREKGLIRIRALDLPALRAAAQASGELDRAGQNAALAIERLLRRAADGLGEGVLGDAGRYLFGLVPGTRGRSPADLRRRAAQVWGITSDSFRKEPERTVLGEVAHQVQAICAEDAQVDEQAAESTQESALSLASTVIGFHGTTPTAALAILHEGFRPSRNKFDWLGDGVYFFQDGPSRALDWAKKQNSGDCVVIQADIDLEGCMDLLEPAWFAVLAEAHDRIVHQHRRAGLRLPRQAGLAHGMDRLVINEAVGALEEQGMHIRSVRAVFQEGAPAFPGSALFDLAHIQIAVRDLSTISHTKLFPGGM